jgi:3-phosphoshikimate 1-carboxyvinyltransferase
MSLPALIEIVPRGEPLQAEITVPGSKSITNRALVLAALADGETTLQGALWSEDTQIMVEGLRALGVKCNVAPDPGEPCNRTITVTGLSGVIAPGGTPDKPLVIYVGNAGTAARFLAALVCLGKGVFRLQGVPRMHERPQAALFQALRELGYDVISPNERLPAVIHGVGPLQGECRVSIEKSSQFASALILCASKAGWRVSVTGVNAIEAPYVRLTERMVAAFPYRGGVFSVEPDASSGSYFWGIDRLLSTSPGTARSRLRIEHWPTSNLQVDQRFPELIGSNSGLTLPQTISRENTLGDSIMTAIVLAPYGTAPVAFTDLQRMRLQECERVQALRTELTKCGARVLEEGDSLTVYPSQLHGAEIETYNDHRMAMCFAILGLKVPGIKLKNPSCVKKTFPNFFQKLAHPAPHGLGVRILDGSTGVGLGPEELFAE